MRNRILFVTLLIGLATFFSSNGGALAQEPFLAEIRMFSGNFAPRGWAFCDGQLLPIAQNTALFSIVGTTFGGDGRTTFGLPDLRGRVPIGPRQGPGLTSRRLGEKGGAETVEPKKVVQAAAAKDDSNRVSVLSQGKVNNMQPFITVNFIIALQGTFPSRN